MAYTGSLSANAAAPSSIGRPPTAAGQLGKPPGGGPPPPQSHIEPAPYDVAKDPGWKGIVDPNDHELRNVLNNMSPEERQVLQQRIQMVMSALKPGAVPAGVPPDAQQGINVPGLGAPGISTRPDASAGPTLPPGP